MKIIEPQVELWLQDDPVTHVAKCARVCYGSKEGKSTDQQLYDSLLKVKHLSMFRHESVYAVVPYFLGTADLRSNVHTILEHYFDNPFINIAGDNKYYFISTNKNFILDKESYDPVVSLIEQFQVPPKEFENAREAAWNIMRYTFHITTQISTSRELNRVSPNAISEQSTRYVNKSEGTICRPHWLCKESAERWNNMQSFDIHLLKPGKDDLYVANCLAAFNTYKALIDIGVKREDARGVLPLDTATEVVYTYSIPEWRHIIALRSDKRAHPNAAIIANMVKEQLKQLGYDF